MIAMKRFILLVLCTMVATAAIAQNERAIKGVVYNEDNVPIANASIRAAGNKFSVNADGSFAITVPSNIREITAYAEGYHPLTLEIEGLYLIFSLKVNKEYLVAKEMERQAAEQRAAEAAAAAKKRAAEEAAAKEKAKKKENRSFMIMCVGIVALMWFVGYYFNGAELAEKPTKRQVVSVEAVNTRYSDEAVICNDEDSVFMACEAFEIVRVKHKEFEGEFEPYLTLTYYMKDGSEKVLQIADGAALWNGMVKPLVREDMMLDAMDLVFFQEYAESEE